MLDRPIAEIPLVFVDTETTGLSPRFGDRIVEIALAQFRGDVMEDYYVSFVNPGRPIPLGATRIHGITDQDVCDAPSFLQLIPELRHALLDAVLVAHNAPFDLGFIGNEFHLAREAMPTNLVLDTLALLRRHFDFPSNSLPRVADLLGIHAARRHRALADVLTTREVFGFLTEKLAARSGARTLGDFMRLQGGAVAWREPTDENNLPLPPALFEALQSRRRLFIRYRDVVGEQTERWVSPLGVREEHDIIYLRAYCHLRSSERVFRLDRIIEIRLED